MEENKKNNKKKLIIIIAVAAGILLIGVTSFFVARLINGGKKLAKEVNKVVEKIEENTIAIELGNNTNENPSDASSDEEKNESSTEKLTEEVTEEATEAETESVTEVETEAPTEAPAKAPAMPQIDYDNVDWFAVLDQVFLADNVDELDWEAITNVLINNSQPTGNEREILLNEIKKSDNYDSIDWNAKYEPGEIVTGNYEEVIITNQPTTEAVLSEEDKLAQQLKWDKGSYGKNYYQEENKTIYINRTKDDIVMQTKNAWIKENFGTSFTYNGYEFGWDETNQLYYWVYKYGNIHYMTSISTSILGQYYRNFYSYRIADYLGFHGTDYIGYHNEESLKDEIFILDGMEEKMTVENPEANNVAYLKQLGWTDVVEDDGVDRWWEYESPEGVPAYVWEDGYIAVYVRYPEDSKENLCEFTIEEYNDLINNTNWTIHSQSGKFGWGDEDQSEWEPFIKKYLVIS